MKAQTDKYTYYKETGQVYTLENRYIRTLTESQMDFLRGWKFGTRAGRVEFDRLIDTDFKDAKIGGMTLKEAIERTGRKHAEDEEIVLARASMSTETQQDCQHFYKVAASTPNGLGGHSVAFYCTKCLKIVHKQV